MTQPDGPERTLALLAKAPTASPVALMLRHAEREEITPGAFGNDVPLTRDGSESARRLGMGLSSRMMGVVKSSPLPRCTQTADAIIAGAGWKANATPDRLLGDPGPFVVEPELAGRLFLDIGIEEIVRRQLADDQPPSGMRSTSSGARLVLRELAAALNGPSSIGVFVTHDAVLAALVGHLYRLPVQDFPWPDYLDALVVWPASDRLRFLWRGLGEGAHPVGG